MIKHIQFNQSRWTFNCKVNKRKKKNTRRIYIYIYINANNLIINEIIVSFFFSFHFSSHLNFLVQLQKQPLNTDDKKQNNEWIEFQVSKTHTTHTHILLADEYVVCNINKDTKEEDELRLKRKKWKKSWRKKFKFNKQKTTKWENFKWKNCFFSSSSS